MDKPKDAGPLGLHFERMLALKEWLKGQVAMSHEGDVILKETYKRLDELIKSTDEQQKGV